MSSDPKIVYEDGEVLVLEKPAGMVVNRGQTVKGPTLQDWVLDYLSSVLPKGSDPNIGDRAGIVHRLDRETSGLLIVAKTTAAFDNLQAQFKNRQVKKEYVALVHGKVAERSGTIEEKIGRVGKFGKFGVVKEGREAKTGYEVQSVLQASGAKPHLRGVVWLSSGSHLEGEIPELSRSRLNYLKHHAVDYTLLALFPQTGRTHQIRVHLKSIGHPVVADPLYAPRKLLRFDLLWCPRLFLHAAKISFTHPVSGKTVTLSSDLPKDLKDAILNLALKE